MPERISVMSLDHDLGDAIYGTGYDVVKYIEEQVFFNNKFPVPVIMTHSQNPIGREAIIKSIQAITKLAKREK